MERLKFEEALDLLMDSDEFLSAAEDKDLKAYIGILQGKVIKNFSVNDVDFDDRPKFFITTVQEIVTPQNLEQCKQTLGSVYYIYLSGLFNKDTALLDSSFKYDIPDDADVNIELAEKGHINNIIVDNYDHYVSMLHYCTCDNLTLSNLNYEDLNVRGGSQAWKSITIDAPLERLGFNRADKVIYTKNSLLQNDDGSSTIPVIAADVGWPKEIYLPNVPNIRLPRWLVNGDFDVTIYKAKGQKIGIYSMYKDWCKKHIKSI